MALIFLWLRMLVRRTAGTILRTVGTVTPAAHAVALEIAHGGPRRRNDGGKDQQADYVHQPNPNKRPAVCTSSAASQAITHWPTSTPTAHFPPSSRRIEEIAATQGV